MFSDFYSVLTRFNQFHGRDPHPGELLDLEKFMKNGDNLETAVSNSYQERGEEYDNEWVALLLESDEILRNEKIIEEKFDQKERKILFWLCLCPPVYFYKITKIRIERHDAIIMNRYGRENEL